MKVPSSGEEVSSPSPWYSGLTGREIDAPNMTSAKPPKITFAGAGEKDHQRHRCAGEAGYPQRHLEVRIRRNEVATSPEVDEEGDDPAQRRLRC